MKELKKKLVRLNVKKKIMYIRLIFVGLLNTAIGYLSLLALKTFFNANIDIFYLALLSRIFTILVAYLNFKLLVFKTGINYFKFEIIKIYMVYALSTIFFISSITVLINFFDLNFHLALLITIFFNFLFTSKSHIHYTFNGRRDFKKLKE